MRRLVILRPEPGASASVDRARAIGLDAFAIPLFAVETLPWDVPDPSGFDALLLTSANAIRHAGKGLEKLRHLPVHAVGEATADAAREAGFEIVSVGDGGVEKLLDSLASRWRLLHVCGEHRIAPRATQAITAVAVYRSAELPARDDLAQIEGQVVAVHSPRAGCRLAELVDQARIDRRTTRIAAISDAAMGAVGGGWEQCESADRPDDSALLALAARLCDNPVTR